MTERVINSLKTSKHMKNGRRQAVLGLKCKFVAIVILKPHFLHKWLVMMQNTTFQGEP